jgi:hypothetical protein
MMLLGSIDRVQVTGLPYPWDVRVDLQGVRVSVPSLIITAERCSPLRVQNIDQIQCQQFGE